MRSQAERDEKTIEIGVILACLAVVGLAITVVGQTGHGWIALGVVVMVLGVVRDRRRRR
ncbi:hypothetical protein [Nocardioides sp. 1609]|uniref:hypothetical protein n=1 Tax=Nocardioides sp. 1609 TaxID=2508327 RepID=UPI0014302B94|nr:hypothetical protein [Nocardioides sp. 1609]